jgi:tRNA pseudouridine55 synthase
MMSSGYVLVDKKAGMTSFSSLETLKKAMSDEKVGHTGTLDSFATGLLVAVVGSYSRLAPWFSGMDKLYFARVRFGLTTDTLDPHGKDTGTGPVPEKKQILTAMLKFQGEIEQVPPSYSAIHVNGKRAYDLALKGLSPELKPRKVNIFDFRMEEFANGEATFLIACSSGTYVRALGRDLAAECGTVAYVTELRRLRVGCFSVEDAVWPEMFDYRSNLRQISPETATAMGLASGAVPNDKVTSFTNGEKTALFAIYPTPCKDHDTAIFSPDGNFLGIVNDKDGRLAYRIVLAKAVTS